MKSFNRYARDVVQTIHCDRKTKQRIREDVLELLQDRYEESGIADPVALLGSPEEFATSLREEIGAAPSPFYTRKSETTLLGIPLYMISNHPSVTSKAWFAVGTKSIGFFSIGAFSIGAFSFGGFGLGLFAFGGLAAGIVTAIGGVAIAYNTALGGVAIASQLAMGGIAIAREIAIGGLTSARLMAYNQSYIPPTTDAFSKSIWAFRIPDELDQFRDLFNRHFANFGSIKRSLIESILRMN